MLFHIRSLLKRCNLFVTSLSMGKPRANTGKLGPGCSRMDVALSDRLSGRFGGFGNMNGRVMWCNVGITIIHHPPVITIDSWYKPFPHVFFLDICYTQILCHMPSSLLITVVWADCSALRIAIVSWAEEWTFQIWHQHGWNETVLSFGDDVGTCMDRAYSNVCAHQHVEHYFPSIINIFLSPKKSDTPL